MADEQPPERDMTIQSTVNVGTANDSSTVGGAKVSIRSARDVHIHGDTTPPPSFRSVALVGVLAFLGAVLVNYATSVPLPESWRPHLWLAWPLAVFVTGASIVFAYRQGRSSEGAVIIPAVPNPRNRLAMLDKVEKFWIKGVLEQSLYQIARLELGLEQAPERVNHPWQTILQQAATSRAVPAGTSTIQLFDDLDGKLLILGAPGAGKTTLLLELARDLLARARQDPQHSIPLVFNLSTWASKRRPLKEWLADELNQRYDVNSNLASAWIEADAILPLLDGLDEVAAEYRDACIEAINVYRQNRGLVPLTVCSRMQEYTRLTDKLKLQGAVIIQPLTQQTVDTYLLHVGLPLIDVRKALEADRTLWELLDSPLMLSIVALAYKDKSPTKLRARGKLKERRKQLFDDYIGAMFERRSKETRFTQQQTIRWLSWLARQMVVDRLTVYYIEQMQPDWLTKWSRSWYIIRPSLLIALLIGLASSSVVVSVVVLVVVLVVGFWVGGGSIDITETVKPSKLLNALVVGMGVVLIFELLFSLNEVLVFLVVFGLIFCLLNSLHPTDLAMKSTPNQGIRRSGRTALLVGLGAGLGVGLVIGLSGGLSRELLVRSAWGLGVGLIVGLLFVMDYGGRAVLQHYTLRWMLYRSGSLPIRLVPFLDYCTERIFLRRVGGGYIFVHRLLMEHFARLYTEGTTGAPPK